MAQATPNHAATRQNYRIIALSAIFVLLNAMDAQLTLLAVENGATELNPIMRMLLAQSDWVFWFSKISWALVFAIALVVTARWCPRPVIRILTVLVGITAWVCVLNLMGVVL